MRLDQALAQKYHLTRNRAQQLIEAGLVSINQKPIFKASYTIDDDQSISLQEDRKIHWVSRSAEKLFTYLEYYPIPLSGKQALDIGSSTGGFTQVLVE
jgi:23S rRNA (cytidine1920-2'-O)/16S rRNA (cytidine1409-2'-O)-methyltransferase